VLEDAVLAWLTDRAGEVEAAALEFSERPKRKPVKSAVIDIDSKLAALSGKMDKLAERLIDPGIPFATYNRLRDKYESERKALEASRLTVAVEERVDPYEVIPGLLSAWKDGLVSEKREILRALKITVTVWPQRPISRVAVHSALQGDIRH
jgi:hypothetical protein